MPDGGADPAYPTITPADAVYPCQTLEPLGPPLDGVALPTIWSRLCRPLEGALFELGRAFALGPAGWPDPPVGLHYGRIAVNAHLWERLRSRWLGEPPDPALVPPDTGFAKLASPWHRLRAHRGEGRLRVRIEFGLERSEALLAKLAETSPALLDTLELARGPLHEPAWRDILVAWLASSLWQNGRERAEALVRSAIALEERHAAEMGRRLAQASSLESAAFVAYLTVSERLRAAQEPSPLWQQLASERRRRVEVFLEVELPQRFWGRPRVELPKEI